MKAVELAKRIYDRRRKYFENLDHYLGVISDRVRKLLPDARVYLFGSVVEGRIHPLSDIDVAIVSKNAPKKVSEIAKLKLKVLEGFEFSPFELHILTEEEWEFYKKFVRGKFRDVG